MSYMSDYLSRELERERELERRQAEMAFRRDLAENWRNDWSGTYYRVDRYGNTYGCGRYQDADGNWHSEM